MWMVLVLLAVGCFFYFRHRAKNAQGFMGDWAVEIIIGPVVTSGILMIAHRLIYGWSYWSFLMIFPLIIPVFALAGQQVEDMRYARIWDRNKRRVEECVNETLVDMGYGDYVKNCPSSAGYQKLSGLSGLLPKKESQIRALVTISPKENAIDALFDHRDEISKEIRKRLSQRFADARVHIEYSFHYLKAKRLEQKS
jgi:hypothetical protein